MKVKSNNDLFPINFDVRDVVFEDCGHVNFGELILAEHDQEAGLAAGAVADDHQLLSDGRHLCCCPCGCFCCAKNK
jgi:hypothetical protein